MAFGILCINTSGELTLSSDGFLLSYLGKASFVSSSGYSGVASSCQIGGSVWQFTSANPIICAIGLKSSGQAGAVITRVTQSGSTWTIYVRDLSTTTEGPSGGGSFYAQRTDSDIYVFGLPAAPAAYGIALYNSSGVFSGDLSRPPLAAAARVVLASGGSSQTIPSLVKPAIIGSPNSRHTLSSSGHGGGTPWLNTKYEGAWQWNGSTTLNRFDALVDYERDDGGIPVVTVQDATHGILIEANGLS